MSIKTFEDVRRFIIDKCHIDAMVDFGLDRVNLFGPGILLDATFYVLSKGQSEKEGLYFNLTTNLQEKFKKERFLGALDNYVSGVSNDRIYSLEQTKLKIIKSWPFIYGISDELRQKFGETTIKDISVVLNGVKTGGNEKLLRFWWEICADKKLTYNQNNKHWIKYAKGGPFNKWHGNMWLCINYLHDGMEIKKSRNHTLLSKENSFRVGITYTNATSKGVAFRVLESDSLFDMSGPAIILNKPEELNYVIGILNSNFIYYIANCLNSTVHTQIGDIKRIPFVISVKWYDLINSLASNNIAIKKNMQRYSIIENVFDSIPLKTKQDFKVSIKILLNYENHLLTQVLINEAIINEKTFEVYDLTELDKAMVLAKEGESIGGLPVLAKARDAYLADTETTKEFPLNAIRDFIQSLPKREFTAEERETIESDFPSLYQSNNDLEEFCIRHQVNPINIWYWFKQSNVIPQQRMHTLALEFLADMIREILMEDEDGIIPLVPNAGETVLLDHIEMKFREKGFSLAQYSSFDTVLGCPIHEYLLKYFFSKLSDHLNLFMYLPKTPFIWHLSSGPEQGFACYIIVYKWSRDKCMRLRSVYIEHRERSLVNRQSDLAGNDSAEAQTEKDRIFRQLKEIAAFKVKIDELLAEGYNPILDDGVGKNIAPLQKKKMIPYEVLNEGQLEKYLNADW